MSMACIDGARIQTLYKVKQHIDENKVAMTVNWRVQDPLREVHDNSNPANLTLSMHMCNIRYPA